MKKYVIKVKESFFRFDSYDRARIKIKELIDAGIWFVDLCEEDDIVNDTRSDTINGTKEKIGEVIKKPKQTKKKGVRKKRENYRYTEEINDFIKENWKENMDKELVRLLKNEFHVEFSVDQIKAQRKKKGWVASHSGRKKAAPMDKKKKIGSNKYPKEMVGFIEMHMNQASNPQLCDLINGRYEIGITPPRLAAYMSYKKLKRENPNRQREERKKEIDKYEIGIIHLNHNGKYACNEKTTVNQNKLSKDWEKINCDNCKRKFEADSKPEVNKFIQKSTTEDVYDLRDKIIEKFEVDIPIAKLRNLMMFRKKKIPGENVEEEVKRIEEQRETFDGDDEDIEDLELDD